MTKLGRGDLVSRAKSVIDAVVHRRHPHDGDRRRVTVIGHRGAPREAPENTRRSFVCAIEHGATAVEVDVCRTRDGRFVLWHDPDPREHITIARDLGEGLGYVANEPAIGSACRKPISELSYDEFMCHYGYTRRRDAISHMLDGDTTPEVRPEPIESLLELVAAEPRLRDVYVDIKLRPDQLDDARALAALLDDPRFHLLSAEREVVSALEARATGDFELTGVLEGAREHGLRHVSMGVGQRLWIDFYPELCDVIAARDRGELESVIVWTFNDEERLRELAALGVDGIITDDAALLCRVLAEPRAST